MRYNCDEAKNRRNVALHGIGFDDAKRIFEGSTVERVDDRFDYGEVRVYAIGLVNGLEITVVFRTKTMTKDGSSRSGGRNRTKDGPTGKTLKAKQGAGTDWARLRRRNDAQVHAGIESDPDARATDEEFWKNAKVVWPGRKAVVTMRLDQDLLDWFRRERGYQTRINAILRAYMAAHASSGNG